MKKYSVFLLFVLFVSFTGCSKDDETGLKIVKSIDDPFGYAQFHLELIAQGLPSVMGNSVFRTILDDEVGKCFDGDYNVLFVRLVEACDSANLDLINEMKIYLFANGQDTSLFDPVGAFNGIEGHNYYPQIYIPFFTDNAWDNEELPVAIAFNGDESLVDFEGYTMGSGNHYEVVGGIDEDFSYNRQVWVISLNECVDDNGIPLDYFDEEGFALFLPGDETQACGGTQVTDAQINKITIKERFEHWAGGRSDIAIRSYVLYKDGIMDNFLGTLGYWRNSLNQKYRGRLIKRVKKNEIGNELTINYPIVTKWGCGDEENERIHFVHIIFERDAWPAQIGFGWNDIMISGKYHNMEVRSYNQSGSQAKQVYILECITSMPGIDNRFYNPFSRNNTLIQYNINKKP